MILNYVITIFGFYISKIIIDHIIFKYMATNVKFYLNRGK